MDMRISNGLYSPATQNHAAGFGASVARRVTAPQTPLTSEGTTPAAQVGFSQAFKNALQAVSEAQNQSRTLQQEVQLENPNVTIEEAMVAMQKAQIGFQTALHVRNRMMQAYTDIMNMQV